MSLKINNSSEKLEYDFIQKLIKRRKELGISQQELASLAGFPQSTVARYETMNVSPSLSTLMKICEILNIKFKLNEIKPINKNLVLVVDMHGCPNRCKHCWLGDLPNNIMDDGSDELIVNLFKPYFKNITFYSWLREPDFCQNYQERFKKDNLLSSILPKRFELASFYKIVRDKEYVEFLKEVGTKKVQLTFFGLKEMTDKYVGRNGAYEELIEASNILKANKIEPRWQIFINEENKADVVKLLDVAKKMNINEIIIHEGSCDGNNMGLYDIRINKQNIPDEVKPFYLDYENILTEKECIELLKDEDSHFIPHFDDEIVLNITSDFNVYFNYTNPLPKWRLGNILEEDIEIIIERIINNDVEAIRISKEISIKELIKKYGNINSNKVFSLDDYKMYLLNSHIK